MTDFEEEYPLHCEVPEDCSDYAEDDEPLLLRPYEHFSRDKPTRTMRWLHPDAFEGGVNWFDEFRRLA